MKNTTKKFFTFLLAGFLCSFPVIKASAFTIIGTTNKGVKVYVYSSDDGFYMSADTSTSNGKELEGYMESYTWTENEEDLEYPAVSVVFTKYIDDPSNTGIEPDYDNDFTFYLLDEEGNIVEEEQTFAFAYGDHCIYGFSLTYDAFLEYIDLYSAGELSDGGEISSTTSYSVIEVEGDDEHWVYDDSVLECDVTVTYTEDGFSSTTTYY